jgi:hypothetical protein
MSQPLADYPKNAAHKSNESFVSGLLTFHQATIQRLAADKQSYRIQMMKITKNIGMLLLAVYLIVDGLLGFGLNLGPGIFLLYVLAIIAGILILLGK